MIDTQLAVSGHCGHVMELVVTVDEMCVEQVWQSQVEKYIIPFLVGLV